MRLTRVGVGAYKFLLCGAVARSGISGARLWSRACFVRGSGEGTRLVCKTGFSNAMLTTSRVVV